MNTLQQWPQTSGEENGYTGIYICPVCSLRRRLPLPYRKEYLSTLLKFSSNRLFRARHVRCLRCHSRMLLEKILDSQGKLVLDSSHWLHSEIQRLREFS